MESPILKLFSDLTDEDLVLAIAEIKENSKNGFIKDDGFVREMARKMKEITMVEGSMDLTFSEINLLREAAYRWLQNK